MSDTYNVAVVGATGVVGEALFEILAQRKFPVGRVHALASERSLGKTVSFGKRKLDVENLAEFDFSGVDIGLFANDSNIRFISESLTARNGYLMPSVKWMFGDRHRYSLDAGVGYYLQDIAEVAGEYPMIWETQLWEDNAIGAYVGGTVDFMGGVPSKSRGVMMSLKVHLVDFGTVRDEGRLPPTLGQGAGSLAGPVYMYQIGWRWR